MTLLETVQAVDVAKVRRYDRLTKTTRVFYVVAAKITLTLGACVDAAQVRWQIENHGFKRCNALCASKHRYSASPEVMERIVLLLMAAQNLLVLFYHHSNATLSTTYRGLKGSVKHLVLLLQGSVELLTVVLNSG
jgi:hypothetical protein